jgi:hypothetical protein
VKKIGPLYTIAILLAAMVARCTAQAVPTGQQASPTAQQTQGFIVHGSAQSITLPSVLGQSVDSPPLRLSATDSVGLPVTFGTLTPSSCSVSNNVITFLSSGTCTLAADRGGAGMFVSASKVAPDFTGCDDCTIDAPTLPQWCAIVMGLVLIGLSIFLMRRSKASTIS